MPIAPVSWRSRLPSVVPTRAGTSQPVPPFDWLVKWRAEMSQPECAGSTPMPSPPRTSELIRSGNGFGFETVASTSPDPPG